MVNDFESVLDEMFGSVNATNKYPLTDIAYDEKSLVLFIDIALAGVRKEDIDISVEDNILTVKGSMQKDTQEGIVFTREHIARRDFVRKIKLSQRYIGEEIKASHENGILSLSISPNEKYTRKIEIQ